jgi:FkbM family methyltransferase
MAYSKTTSCGELGLVLHKIYQDYFGYIENGTFIEIGANDGKTGSFTFNLAKIGWRGVYCEPVKRIYKKCQNNHKMHPKITVLNYAVGDGTEKTATIIDGDTLSTIDNDTLNLYKNTTQFSGIFRHTKTSETVNVVTLDDMLETQNIDDDFQLLIIDVEGYEDKVLNGFDINKYKPQMVIIEIPDQHPDFNDPKIMLKFRLLREYFDFHGYKLIINDIVDNVYVRTDKNIDYSDLINFPQFKKCDHN